MKHSACLEVVTARTIAIELHSDALAKECADFVLLQIIRLDVIVKLHGFDEKTLAQAFQGILCARLSALVTIQTESHPSVGSYRFDNQVLLRL